MEPKREVEIYDKGISDAIEFIRRGVSGGLSYQASIQLLENSLNKVKESDADELLARAAGGEAVNHG